MIDGNEEIVEKIKKYLVDNLSSLEELNKEFITQFKSKEDDLRKEITNDERRTKVLLRVLKNSEEELLKNNSLIQQIASKIDSKNVIINSPQHFKEIRNSFFMTYLGKLKIKEDAFNYQIMEYIYNNYLFTRFNNENNEEQLLTLTFYWFISNFEYMSHIFTLIKIISPIANFNNNSLKDFVTIYQKMKIEKDYSKIIINEPLLFVFEFVIYTFIKLFCTKSKKEIGEYVQPIYEESERITKLNYCLIYCGFWKIEFCKSFYEIFAESLYMVPVTLENLYPEKIENYDIYIFKKQNMVQYCGNNIDKTNKFKEAIIKYFTDTYLKNKNIALLEKLLKETELIPYTKLLFQKILEQFAKISSFFKDRDPCNEDDAEKVDKDIKYFIENQSSYEILKFINNNKKEELDFILCQSFSDTFNKIQNKQSFLKIIFLNINKYLIIKKEEQNPKFLYHLASLFFKSYLETYFQAEQFLQNSPLKEELYNNDAMLEKSIRKYLELELPKMNLPQKIKNEVEWKFDLFLNFLYDYPMHSFQENLEQQNWQNCSIEKDDPYKILTTIKDDSNLNLIYFDYFVNNKLTSKLSSINEEITLTYYNLVILFLKRAKENLEAFLPNSEMLLYSIKIYWYCAFKTKSYYHLFYEKNVKKLLESNYIPGRQLYKKQKEWEVKVNQDIKILPEKKEAAKKKIEEMEKLGNNNQQREEMLKAFVLILNKYKESDTYSIPLTLGESKYENIDEEDEEGKTNLVFSFHLLNFINYSIVFCSKLLGYITKKDCVFLFMDEDCIEPLKIHWKCIEEKINKIKGNFHNFLNSFFGEVFSLESEEIVEKEKKEEFENQIDLKINKLLI